MTGKHSPGYLAAYAAATREAARRFREDNPDEWAHILKRQQQARLDNRKGGDMSEWDDLNEGGAMVDDMIDQMMDADEAAAALRGKGDIEPDRLRSRPHRRFYL